MRALVSRSTLRFAAAVVFAGLVALSAPASGTEKAAAVLPEVAGESLEAAVAEQLAGLRAMAAEQLEADESSAADAVGELGRHYHAYGLSDAARQCYELAMELAPRDFSWPYLLAYLAQGEGRLEDAIRLYEKSLSIVPGVSPALIRLAASYAALGNTDKAEWLYGEALQSDPTASAAEAGLGELLLSLDRPAEAAALLQRALEKTPEANRLYYPLALAFRKLGEEDKARELMAWRGSVGIRPADPLIDSLADLKTGERVFLLRGQSAFRVGRFAEAAESFRKVIEINPNSIPGLIDLGSALGQMGRADEAIEIFERAVELAPGNETALFNLGVLLSRKGDFGRAIDYLSQAGQFAPSDGQIRLELAQALRQAGRHEDSLLHFDHAIQALPALEAPRLGKAQSQVRLGDLAGARATLEEALEQLPGSAVLAVALSRVLASAVDPEVRDADRAVQLALNVFESRQRLTDAEWVAEALASSGRCAEAASWQKQVLEQAETAGQDGEVVGRLSANLERFESGAPCDAAASGPSSGSP